MRKLSDQEIDDFFMSYFDCYADCSEVEPAMSKRRFLEVMKILRGENK